MVFWTLYLNCVFLFQGPGSNFRADWVSIGGKDMVQIGKLQCKSLFC